MRPGGFPARVLFSSLVSVALCLGFVGAALPKAAACSLANHRVNHFSDMLGWTARVPGAPEISAAACNEKGFG